MTFKESRAYSRLKLAFFGSAANVLNTLLNFAVFFISVPLTVEYLGEERFGIWMTVASIAGMLTFLDFGVGNGMVSQVAKFRVEKNGKNLRNTITRGLVILGLIGGVIGVVLYALNALFPLVDFVKLETEAARRDTVLLSTLFIGLFAISIPLNGIFKIMSGLQLSWIVNLIRAASSLVSIFAVIYLAQMEAEPGYLLFATYGLQVLAPLVLIPYFFKNSLFGPLSACHWSDARDQYLQLFQVGGLFLALQIGMMCGWGADALIISALSGVAAVAQFAVAQRLFQLVRIPLTIINTPLWAAYADAHAHGDTAFIRKTLTTSLLATTTLGIVISVTVLYSSAWILEFWLDDKIEVSHGLLVGFAIWKVVESVGHAISMALNGMHVVKEQVIAVSMLCILVLPMKFYFTPVYGPQAVVWSTVIAFMLSTILFYLVIFRRQIFSSLTEFRTTRL
ncbi:MAG: lipopolysaccharide biosynthesis protein [Granulosicoccus sp.]